MEDEAKVYVEVAKWLRDTVRRADRFGHSRQDILEILILQAENYEDVADRLDMDSIVAIQREKVSNG